MSRHSGIGRTTRHLDWGRNRARGALRHRRNAQAAEEANGAGENACEPSCASGHFRMSGHWILLFVAVSSFD